MRSDLDLLWRHCERFGLNPHTEIDKMEPAARRHALAWERLRESEDQAKGGG